jgi:hypothetical protein
MVNNVFSVGHVILTVCYSSAYSNSPCSIRVREVVDSVIQQTAGHFIHEAGAALLFNLMGMNAAIIP